MNSLKWCAVVCLIPVLAFGQAVVRGTVIDSSTSEPLIGASVILKGTAFGAPTDLDGRYRLSNVPPGNYVLTVSYLGYHPSTRSIDVDQEDLVVDFRLTQAIIEGEEVIVTGQLKGQVAAINQQINSKTIVSVISEDKIKELPDANAAEAIGRLPGVSIIRSGGEATGIVLRGLSSKFSNITVDGVKIPPTDQDTRDVDLSMLSQGALAGIELYKTLTSDQDGDAIAGSVNLVTKSAPEERLLYVDAKGGYNHLLPSFNQYDVSVRYGERFFEGIVGVQLQANVERKIRSRENTNTQYSTFDNSTLPDYGTYDNVAYDNDYFIGGFRVRFTDETRRRNGGQAIFDLRTPDGGTIKTTGVYSETRREIMTYERFYPVSGGTGGGFSYNYDAADINTSTINASLQGTNYLMGLKADWLASFAQSRTDNPFGYRMAFTEASGGTGVQAKDHPELNLIPYANNNFANTTLDSSLNRRLDNFDKEQTFAFNLSREFDLGSLLKDEVKVGWKLKEKTRWKNNQVSNWNNYGQLNFFSPDGAPVDFTGTRFEGTHSAPDLTRFISGHPASRDLLGKYRLTPLIDVGAFRQWVALTKDAIFPTSPLYYGADGLAILGNYDVQEQVQSWFVMNTLTLGQTATVIAGLRVERESNTYGSHYSDGSVGGTGAVIKVLSNNVIDTTATYQETILLPSAQIAFRPTENLTLRLAAYRALARPDFNLRIPQFSFQERTAIMNLIAGNPELKDSKAWNFEFNVQWHDITTGLVSVSAFYKRIDDLFHRSNSVNVSWPSGGPNQLMGLNGWTTSSQSGAYHRLDLLLDELGMSSWKQNPIFQTYLHNSFSFQVSIPYNSPTPSTVWGLEFEHQMNFGFLPVSWLRSITLTYNVSLTRSRTDVLLSRTLTDTVYIPAVTVPRPRPASYTYLVNNVAGFETRDSEDQPEIYANAVLGYDIAGFSARLSVFYQDRYTAAYSSNGTADAIVDAFTKWDLSLKQEVSPSVSVFLNINNIFNKFETRSSYNNIFDWGYLPRTAELYGTSADMGVRVSL